MKSIKTLAVIAIMLCSVSFAAQAFSDRIALVTIRFNQPKVVYQNQLYNAVVEAVKVKPSVNFTVVGYAPQHSDSGKAAKLFENTQYYTQRIADDLLKIGVNPQQVRTDIEPMAQVRNEEVRIFVD